MNDLGHNALESLLSDPDPRKLDALFNQIVADSSGEWDGCDDGPWHALNLPADTWDEEEEEKCTR